MFTTRLLPKVATIMIVWIIALSSIQPALAASTVPAPAESTVSFEATFHHFTTPEGSCVDEVCNYISLGYGTVNIMGSPFVVVRASVVWNFNTSPCSTLESAQFTLFGETGSITISGTGTVCPGNSPEGFPASTSFVGVITRGTGEFSGISGTITGQGLTVAIGPVLHLSGDISH